MSQNLDLVRSIYAAWERGDWSSLAWAHPEVEFIVADGPDPLRTSGPAEMAAAVVAFLSTWDDLRTEAQEYRELDDERILVHHHNRGRGKASGVEINERIGTGEGASLFTLRGASVVKLVVYWNREHALADLD